MSVYEIESRKQDEFEVLMHASRARNDAVKHLIEEIERLSGRSFEDADKEKLQDFLAWLPYEDGSSLFMCDAAPDDKELVGSVELSLEHITFYFGENRRPNGWPFATGIHFSNKKMEETIEFSMNTFKAEFPTFANESMTFIQPEVLYRLIIYTRAGELYKTVMSQGASNGKWLIQVPTAVGSFIPNRGIGFFDSASNTIHLCDPRVKHKRDKKYSRWCIFTL